MGDIDQDGPNSQEGGMKWFKSTLKDGVGVPTTQYPMTKEKPIPSTNSSTMPSPLRISTPFNPRPLYLPRHAEYHINHLQNPQAVEEQKTIQGSRTRCPVITSTQRSGTPTFVPYLYQVSAMLRYRSHSASLERYPSISNTQKGIQTRSKNPPASISHIHHM